MENKLDYNKIQPIIEAYVCIQTEGSRAGYPHFLVRTTGCTHRCWFGEGGWCDSWYTSITPEKGSWSLQVIKELFESRPDINHLMISGGSPTMHPALVDELIIMFKEMHETDASKTFQGTEHEESFFNTNGFVTIETEGSHFVKTKYPIDLISLSPKFENSVPKVGVQLPNSDKVTDERMVKQHNKFRMNHEAMTQTLAYHKDYHFKPVVDRNDLMIWDEIEKFREIHNVPKNKTWVMPAGDTIEAVMPNYTYVMTECAERGYNFTGRAHIIAFSDKRGV
jgi:7-carboxy-7-deazaguanine synthase